jgi:hypothetical protein
MLCNNPHALKFINLSKINVFFYQTSCCQEPFIKEKLSAKAWDVFTIL